MLSLVDVRFRFRQLSCLQNGRTNERMTENHLIDGGNNNNNLFQRISVLLFRFNSVLLHNSFELDDRSEHYKKWQLLISPDAP